MYLKTQAVKNEYIGTPPLMMAFELSEASELSNNDSQEVLEFLTIRPIHTVVMTSLINDNGLENSLNRGKFYGYKNAEGTLEGVALIGHTTLVEARSENALKALALAARASDVPLHLIMSDGNDAESFWRYFSSGRRSPRLTCTELLFEIKYPFPVRKCDRNVRPATLDEIHPIAEAQAKIAFQECGVDPLLNDRDAFLKRVARRIELGRIFVVVENGKLLFKADIIAETADAIYLEGIYVAPEHRGQGVGPACLAKLSLNLLDRVQNISLLSNVAFTHSHRAYLKAGYKRTGSCVTVFV